MEAGRVSDPNGVDRAAKSSMAAHVAQCSSFSGVVWRRSTTATTSARWPRSGREDAFDFPGFVPAYIRPLFCGGIGPFRWVALSGDPEDISAPRRRSRSLCPTIGICTLARHGKVADSVPRAARTHLLARAR